MHSAESQPNQPATDQVQAEHIRSLYDQTSPALFVHLFDSVVLSVLVWGTVPAWQSVAWMGLMLASSALRILITRVYRRRNPPASEWRRWASIAVGISVLFGAIWGLASILFLDINNPTTVAVLVCIVVALNAGAASTAAPYPLSYYALLLTSSLPMIVMLAIGGGPLGISLTILAIMSLFAHSLICRKAHDAVDRAVRLRFENEALHKEAEQAHTAKSRFLATASHDLRQPVHALNLSFSVLADQSRNADNGALIDRIEDSIGAVDKTLNALLDISKLDAGVMTPQPEALAIQEIFDQLQSEFGETASEQGNRLRVRGSDAVVYSDPAMLHQILQNLIGNALRYTDHGRVLVAARRRADQVRLVVYDTGIGIPKNRLDEIFIEFQQLPSAQRDRNQGLGLGLSIVKRLCDLLAYPLSVQSTPGRGSCFSLSVPAHKTGIASQVAQTVPPPSSAGLEGRRVLIVDDEALILASMTQLLEHWGCKVAAAATVEDAVKQCRDNPPELLVIDYRLPGDCNGIDAVGQLWQVLGVQIPAVIITGDTAPQRLREATESGFALLHKPVKPDQLRRVLLDLVSKASEDSPA